ncbi:MAG: hypothetical protein AAB354_08050 [candidate division KSB1 bacterium]
MSNHIIVNRQVASLTVEELVELIRQTIRTELSELLRAAEQNGGEEQAPAPPPVRNVDAVIARMQATGKYNKRFLASLRKGMQRSQAFQQSSAKAKA